MQEEKRLAYNEAMELVNQETGWQWKDYSIVTGTVTLYRNEKTISAAQLNRQIKNEEALLELWSASNEGRTHLEAQVAGLLTTCGEHNIDPAKLNIIGSRQHLPMAKNWYERQ